MSHLQRSEPLRSMLNDSVHGVRHTEAVGPVVVGHSAVVLLDSQGEADERVLVEASQSEEVDKHVDGVTHLLHVLHVQRTEIVAAGEEVT